ALFAAERLRELRQVRERAVNAETRQRMRIDIGQQALKLRARLCGPAARVGEEETLFGREAVNVGRARLACQRLLPRRISDDQTAKVCDRLADHQLAVLIQPFLNLEL